MAESRSSALQEVHELCYASHDDAYAERAGKPDSDGAFYVRIRYDHVFLLVFKQRKLPLNLAESMLDAMQARENVMNTWNSHEYTLALSDKFCDSIKSLAQLRKAACVHCARGAT